MSYNLIERQASRFQLKEEGFTPLPTCRFRDRWETKWVLGYNSGTRSYNFAAPEFLETPQGFEYHGYGHGFGSGRTPAEAEAAFEEEIAS